MLAVSSNMCAVQQQFFFDCLSLFGLGLDFIFGSVMNIDFIWRTRLVYGTSLAPIVATGVGKEIALSIKSRTRHGSLNRTKVLQALLVVCREEEEVRE